MPTLTAWTADPDLSRWLSDHRDRALRAYQADPLLVDEHGRQEDSFRTGGYADRQVLELAQNAADAQQRDGHRGRVELRLSNDALYCANQGEPFTREGLEAICHAYLSGKRGDEIGRFGLGFKSVLGVSSSPAIFSQSISFGFDAARSRLELLKVAPRAGSFPVLRLPEELDLAGECALDPDLAELADWATTVVKLPLQRVPARLFADLQQFPKEFLLFASSISALTITLVGSHNSTAAEYTCLQDDNRMTLTGTDGERTEWLVWHRQHRPSTQALLEVGETLRREEVRVSYAAPVNDSAPLGRFWAYFPLQDVTSTRGIHNAPWRINDDRTNLLSGMFNQELLDVVADLVVEGLGHLSSAEDPARHFEYLPARGREAPNDADSYLAATIPAKARQTACVPDAAGVLRRPDALIYPHAELKIEPEAFQLWAQAPGRPTDAPHPSCYRTKARAARLRLLVRANEGKASTCEIGAGLWLQRLVTDGTDAQILAALDVLGAVPDPATRRDLLAAKILPDTAGGLHRLDATGEVFLHGHLLSSEAGLTLLRQTLLPVGEAKLQALGFTDVDPQHELRKLATTAARKWTGTQWRAFWGLVEEVNVSAAQEILSRHVASGAPLKVLSRAGTWEDLGSVVVPGLIEPLSPRLALDVAHHELHLGLLQSLGVAARPTVTPTILQDLSFKEYLRLQRQAYLQSLPPRGRPDATSLLFREQSGLSPLYLLQRFADTHDAEAQLVWTRELLEADVATTWQLGHLHHRQYPPQQVTAPHLWAARSHGLLATAWGPRPPTQTLASTLSNYSPWLPVAQLAASVKLPIISRPEDIPLDLWREFLAREPGGEDAWRLGDLLGEACRRLPTGETPPGLPAIATDKNTTVAPQELLLARTEEEQRALADRGIAHAAVRSD